MESKTAEVQWGLQGEGSIGGSQGGLDARGQEARTDRLYQQIGQLRVELDWLKENLAWTPEEKRLMVEAKHKRISVRRQCQQPG